MAQRRMPRGVPASATFQPNDMGPESPALPQPPAPVELSPEPLGVGELGPAVAGVAADNPQAVGLEGPPVALDGAAPAGESPFANTLASTPVLEQVRQAAGGGPSAPAGAPQAPGEGTPEPGMGAEPERPKTRAELQREAITGQRTPGEEFLADESIDAQLRQQELNDQLRQREQNRIEAQRDAQAIAQEQLRPNRYREDLGTFGWIAALIGGAAGGLGGRPEAMAGLINAKIQQDIELQRQDKASRLMVAREKLQSEQGAEEAIRARYWNAVSETAKAQRALGGFRAETVGMLDSLQATAELQAQDAMAAAAAQSALARDKAYQTEAGKLQAKREFAGSGQGPRPGGEVFQVLREQTGATPAEYQKFRASPMMYDGKRFQVKDVANAVNEIATNRAALLTLANEGYKASSEGFITLTERGREVLRTLGLGDMANADRIELESLMAGVVTSVAKSYGGVVTVPDRENAREEVGSSPRSAVAYLDRRLSALKGALEREADAAPVPGSNGMRPMLPFMAPAAFGNARPYTDTN